jgi:hypothetical protein
LPTAGVLPPNDFGIWGEVIPGASVQNGAIGVFHTAPDAVNNYTAIDLNGSVDIRFFKKSTGIFTGTVIAPYTHLANTPFQYQAFQSRVYGMGIRVKQQGGAWSAWTLKNDADGRLDAPIASTYQVGARNNGSHFAGTYPGLLIGQHADPKAELERLTTLYGA